MHTTGNTILITGGSSGIGNALALRLHQLGNAVIVTGRDPRKLEKLRLAQPEIEVHVCDIRNDRHVEGLREKVAGRANILINNAAILQQLSLCEDADLQSQMDEIDTNLNGTLRMVHAFLPSLRRHDAAAIVNVSSALAFVADAGSPIYSATKAALHSLTQSLRHQLRGTNIKVFELIPPLTDTPMAAHAPDLPKLSPEKVVRALIAGLERDRFEITPGLSGVARNLSRLAPRLMFSKLNT